MSDERDLQELMGRTVPDRGVAVGMASAILEESGIQSPPILPDQIAEKYGATTIFGQFPGENHDIFAFYLAAKSTIIVNERSSPERQSYAIAHELAHHLLHKDLILEHPEYYQVLSPDKPGVKDNLLNQEAKIFAAYLLVPSLLLLRYLNLGTPGELATAFNVPDDVIRFRIRDERRITPSTGTEPPRAGAAGAINPGVDFSS